MLQTSTPLALYVEHIRYFVEFMVPDQFAYVIRANQSLQANR